MSGHTARFSVIDPHRMMHTCGLTDGFVLTGIIALTYGQVSVNATRCIGPGLCRILDTNFREDLFHTLQGIPAEDGR